MDTYTLNFATPVNLSDLIIDNAVILLNGSHLFSTLIFESNLNVDLYATFKGSLDNKEVIIKFFFDASDKNNEFEVLDFLNNKNPIFPRPYVCITAPKYESYTIESKDSLTGWKQLDSVWQIIIYEYIPGIPISHVLNVDKSKLYYDIEATLSYMHSLGLIYGDIRPDNIIQTPDLHYRLIDYGRTFSSDTSFPPMDYMIDDDEIPTMEDDIISLRQIRDS